MHHRMYARYAVNCPRLYLNPLSSGQLFCTDRGFKFAPKNGLDYHHLIKSRYFCQLPVPVWSLYLRGYQKSHILIMAAVATRKPSSARKNSIALQTISPTLPTSIPLRDPRTLYIGIPSVPSYLYFPPPVIPSGRPRGTPFAIVVGPRMGGII